MRGRDVRDGSADVAGPHEGKTSTSGCAGCYSGLHALELYAQAFDMVGKIERLEGFTSLHGPDFYGLPRNTETVTLKRQTYTVPSALPFVNGDTLVPLAAGTELNWTFEG